MPPAGAFKRIANQAAELGKLTKKRKCRIWFAQLKQDEERPDFCRDDFKPDLRPRLKRQAFLDAEKKMLSQVHKNKKTKVRKEEMKKRLIPFEDAVFWAAVDPEYTDFTEEFIKATSIWFWERTLREHEVINAYWSLGFSMDPVMNFENSEVTQRQVESRLYGVTWSGKDKPSKKGNKAKKQVTFVKEESED